MTIEKFFSQSEMRMTFEFRSGLRSIGEDLSEGDVDLIWQHADKNGFISFDEFLRMMTL